jgi:hypothetical protein
MGFAALRPILAWVGVYLVHFRRRLSLSVSKLKRVEDYPIESRDIRRVKIWLEFPNEYRADCCSQWDASHDIP